MSLWSESLDLHREFHSVRPQEAVLDAYVQTVAAAARLGAVLVGYHRALVTPSVNAARYSYMVALPPLSVEGLAKHGGILREELVTNWSFNAMADFSIQRSKEYSRCF